MPSVKNPNYLSKNRLTARAAKARKQNQKRSALGQTVRSDGAGAKITKRDQQRGARPGLLPTSGPNAALSSKKRRKLEKRTAHALRRKMEAEGEVVMKDVVDDGATKKGKKGGVEEEGKEKEKKADEAWEDVEDMEIS